MRYGLKGGLVTSRESEFRIDELGSRRHLTLLYCKTNSHHHNVRSCEGYSITEIRQFSELSLKNQNSDHDLEFRRNIYLTRSLMND
ncbi:hypothetical protein DID88_007768 [Monilinia fructigena]|uniref:Uncharacterized protein n=1 Tax=Monilinia fructigena TaxID=38457 RepID=A0A395J4B3_9HELO|nr:hypothetical protein DID88_007768 [Monilinia fructigena]